MRGSSYHSPRPGPAIAWDARRSDPRYASPRTLALATAALPVGFATAQVTGVRPIGGVVMATLGVAALLTSGSSSRNKLAWTTLALALFVASHLLADPIGTWPAVAVVTVAAGASAFRLLHPTS